MPASYPTSVKSFTTKVDGVDDVQAAHVNDLQLEVEAVETDLLKAPTDYSSISTIVGWSSFTTKVLTYIKIGKLVFVQYYLSGTSNNATTTVTLPYAVASGLDQFGVGYAVDNGGTPAAARFQITGSTLFLSPSISVTWTGWTNTGTKTARGHFFYFTS